MTDQFIEARWYSKGGNLPVNRIVIHRMESPEKGSTAEDVARYFQRLPSNRKASAHVCVDNDSRVTCVRDQDIAYHAPPNTHSLGIEHAGYSKDDDWAGSYCDAMLHLSAEKVALWSSSYKVPVAWLSVQDLMAGRRGITSHNNVTLAFRMSDHTDPGPSFPVDKYLALVNMHLTAPTQLPTPTEVHVALSGKAVDILPTNTNKGYWIVASDGGVFSFGDAVYHGNALGKAGATPIACAAKKTDDSGYWLVDEKGHVFGCDADYFGGAAE